MILAVKQKALRRRICPKCNHKLSFFRPGTHRLFQEPDILLPVVTQGNLYLHFPLSFPALNKQFFEAAHFTREEKQTIPHNTPCNKL